MNSLTWPIGTGFKYINMKVLASLFLSFLLIFSLWVFDSGSEVRPDNAGPGGKEGPEEKSFNPETELKRINDLIKEHKNNADLFYNRGWIHESTGDLESAEKDYTKAIEINNKHANAYYNRGLIYLKTERYQRAIDDFSKTIAIKPKSVDAYCNRGNAYFMMGKTGLALRDYNSALILDGEDPDLYYNRALTHLKRGDREKAVADFQKAASKGHEAAKRYLGAL